MAQNIKTAEKVSNHDSEKCYHITHSTQFFENLKDASEFHEPKKKKRTYNRTSERAFAPASNIT